jgi:hypothetical protein
MTIASYQLKRVRTGIDDRPEFPTIEDAFRHGREPAMAIDPIVDRWGINRRELGVIFTPAVQRRS